MASGWHIGDGKREKGKKETFSSSVFYFHRVKLFFLFAVSFDFDRSRSRRFSVPPIENAFPLTQIRKDKTTREKWGNAYLQRIIISEKFRIAIIFCQGNFRILENYFGSNEYLLHNISIFFSLESIFQHVSHVFYIYARQISQRFISFYNYREERCFNKDWKIFYFERSKSLIEEVETRVSSL